MHAQIIRKGEMEAPLSPRRDLTLSEEERNNMEMSASISSIISHFLIRRAKAFALKWITECCVHYSLSK